MTMKIDTREVQVILAEMSCHQICSVRP